MIRKFLGLTALACSLFVAACSSSNDMASYETIISADVPEPVTSAFNTKYPDALDVTWGRQTRPDETEYKAAFTEDGKKKHAEYRERNGIVVED